MSNTPTPSTPHRIVIAGGCHVNGWPIGKASGFVEVMLHDFHCENSSTLAPINLRNCTSLLQLLRQQPADIVVLQFGNYETLASIKKHLRAILHLSRQKHGSSESTGWQLPPDALFSSTPLWRLRGLCKMAYGRTLGHIRPALFDANSFGCQCEQLLSDLEHLQENAPRLVIFLSPIPCADPLISCYRRQAARIIRRLCDAASPRLPFHVCYVDSAQALGITPQTTQALRARIFADDLHLNGRGHLLLGIALATILQTSLV